MDMNAYPPFGLRVTFRPGLADPQLKARRVGMGGTLVAGTPAEFCVELVIKALRPRSRIAKLAASARSTVIPFAHSREPMSDDRSKGPQ
jgi:hypothetical protein